MPSRPRQPSRAASGGPPPEVARLTALGLTAGTPVRFRRVTRTRWYNGRLERLERDGSIGIRDTQGALRSIPAADVQVPATGPRGGSAWQPLIDFLLVGEQIELFENGDAPATVSVSRPDAPSRPAPAPVVNPDQGELSELDEYDPLPMAPPSPPQPPAPSRRPEFVDLDDEPLDPGHCLGQQCFEF